MLTLLEPDMLYTLRIQIATINSSIWGKAFVNDRTTNHMCHKTVIVRHFSTTFQKSALFPNIYSFDLSQQ